MKPRASALSHLERYPNARPSTIRQKVTQDEMHAALRRDIRRTKFRRQIERIKRVFLWPAHVWR